MRRAHREAGESDEDEERDCWVEQHVGVSTEEALKGRRALLAVVGDGLALGEHDAAAHAVL